MGVVVLELDSTLKRNCRMRSIIEPAMTLIVIDCQQFQGRDRLGKDIVGVIFELDSTWDVRSKMTSPLLGKLSVIWKVIRLDRLCHIVKCDENRGQCYMETGSDSTYMGFRLQETTLLKAHGQLDTTCRTLEVCHLGDVRLELIVLYEKSYTMKCLVQHDVLCHLTSCTIDVVYGLMSFVSISIGNSI